MNLVLADIEDGRSNRFCKNNHFEYFIYRIKYLFPFWRKPGTFYNKELNIAIRLTVDKENLIIELFTK